MSAFCSFHADGFLLSLLVTGGMGRRGEGGSKGKLNCTTRLIKQKSRCRTGAEMWVVMMGGKIWIFIQGTFIKGGGGGFAVRAERRSSSSHSSHCCDSASISRVCLYVQFVDSCLLAFFSSVCVHRPYLLGELSSSPVVPVTHEPVRHCQQS